MRISALATAQGQYLTRGSTVVVITPSMRDEVIISADYMHRRGLRPIYLLLDAETFGGPKGVAAIEHGLRLLAIPVRRVANGDNLEDTLNHVGR